MSHFFDLPIDLKAEVFSFLEGVVLSKCLLLCKSLNGAVLLAISQRFRFLNQYFEFNLPRLTVYERRNCSNVVTLLSEYCALMDYLQQGLSTGLWTIYIGPISADCQYNEQSPLVLKSDKLHPNLLFTASENLASSMSPPFRFNLIQQSPQAISTYLSCFHGAVFHAVGYVDVDECLGAPGYRFSFYTINELQIGSRGSISNFSNLQRMHNDVTAFRPFLTPSVVQEASFENRFSGFNVLAAFHCIKDSPISQPYYDEMFPFMVWNIMRKEKELLSKRPDFFQNRDSFCRCSR